MKSFGRTLDRITDNILRFFGSNIFFYIVIAIAIAQASWYIFSFHPWINDEARHFETIVAYSHHLTPFLSQQPTEWDSLGQVVRNGSFLFYYLMSLPLRIVAFFGGDEMTQLILLRIINLSMYIGAIILFRKIFLEMKMVSAKIIHVGLLFFVLTPSAAILAGTVNYDNPSLLLFAYLLLIAVRIVRSKSINASHLLQLMIVALFMTVVKWTSVALIIPVVGFLTIFLWNKHNTLFFKKFLMSFVRLKKSHTITLVLLLAISAGLFIARPVTNMLMYGRPNPGCVQVIGEQRCESFRDYVIRSEIQKPADFRPVSPIRYTLVYWVPIMTSTGSNLLEQGSKTALPVVVGLFEMLAVGGVIVMLMALRELLKSSSHKLLFITMVVYVAFLIFEEYSAYMRYGGPMAVRARYLLPVLPIFIYLVMTGLMLMWSQYRKTMLSAVMIVLLLLTQGGSIITYALTTPEEGYWHWPLSKRINEEFRERLQPFVIE